MGIARQNHELQIIKMNSSISTMTGRTKLKIALLGDQSVGKTSIIERFVKNAFDETPNSTVGVDFLVKNTTHKNKNYRLQLWDTAGQQRFRALIPGYLKDAKCALIVIDVGSKSSIRNIEMWMDIFNQNRKTQDFTFVVLVGNKTDLEYREISAEEANKKAKQLSLPYFEVSAKNGANIEELFQKLTEFYEEKSVKLEDMEKKEEEAIAEVAAKEQASILKEQKINAEKGKKQRESESEKKEEAVKLKAGERKVIKKKEGCCG